MFPHKNLVEGNIFTLLFCAILLQCLDIRNFAIGKITPDKRWVFKPNLTSIDVDSSDHGPILILKIHFWNFYERLGPFCNDLF